MNAQPAKTVFLDYDTVSTGDLDLTALRAASGNLILYDTDESLTAERIRDADVVLLNKLELNRPLLLGAGNGAHRRSVLPQPRGLGHGGVGGLKPLNAVARKP